VGGVGFPGGELEGIGLRDRKSGGVGFMAG